MIEAENGEELVSEKPAVLLSNNGPPLEGHDSGSGESEEKPQEQLRPASNRKSVMALGALRKTTNLREMFEKKSNNGSNSTAKPRLPKIPAQRANLEKSPITETELVDVLENDADPAPAPVPTAARRTVKMQHTDSFYLPKFKNQSRDASVEHEESDDNPHRRVKFIEAKEEITQPILTEDDEDVNLDILVSNLKDFLTDETDDNSEEKRALVSTLLDSKPVYDIFMDVMVRRPDFAEGIARAAKSAEIDLSELSFALLDEASQ